MNNPDPFRANRQFERDYFNGVPEIPYSMYEQNSYSFHLLRYSGNPEHQIVESKTEECEKAEVLGTVRIDYENNLIFNE